MPPRPAAALGWLLTSLAAAAAAGGQTPDSAAPPPQQRFEETLIVTGSAEPLRPSETGRAVDVVTRARLQDLPVGTIADALRLASGVEVSARGDGGVQTDFSLRGATFGQTLVLVDGVRLDDAQTGHHNGDVPVPLSDVERIEVLRGSGSSLYGADAFGGVIQVITRRNGQRAEARLGAGSFGFADAAASARVGGDRLSGSVAASAARSDGFAPDRDFRVLGVRGRIFAGPNASLTLSHLDKDFGASGFYGPAPSRERTRQSLASFERAFSAGRPLAGSVIAFARVHGDHYVYDRRQPALSDNRHESRAVGLALKLHRALPGGSRVSFGAETGADWIDSTALGTRGYGRGSVFVEAQARAGGVTARPGLRFDAYGRFGSALSPSVAFAGPLGARLRWRTSAGRAFRVPTFTELYYHDPNHAASAALRPERAWGADAGLDLDLGRTTAASLTAFGRREDGVIDWVRPSAAERWHTANVHDVSASGVETSLRRTVSGGEIRGRYTWLQTSAPDLPLQSKYVLDFARHALGLDLQAALPGALRLAPSLEYRRKADGREWWLLGVRLSRATGRFDLYAEGRNLLDARYQEVRGVEMPGRSVAIGVRATAR